MARKSQKTPPVQDPADPPKNGAGRPLLYDTPEELQAVIEDYFKECDAKEEPYGVEGLALALGMSRQALLNYEGREEFVDTVKAAKQKIRASVEKILLQGKVGAGAIFWLKNNAGWKDDPDKKQAGNEATDDNFLDALKEAARAWAK